MWGEYMWPDGTIHADKLPRHIHEQLMAYVDEWGNVSPEAGRIMGNYLMFAGFKVKVVVYEADAVGQYLMRLV